KKLEQCSESELFDQSWERLEEVISMGTGAIEIKSGYGLSLENELKMLRVIRKIKEKSPIPVKATFLGAHAFPAKYKNNHKGYIDEIVNEMLPQIAEEGLADYVDAFCEKGYFDIEETTRILEAGVKLSLKPKVHVNQFNSFGAIEACIKNKALSVDHLEVVTKEDIKALQNSQTIATLLPGCSLFISIPYAPARELIDNNCLVSLATDYNPGSAPSGNMNLVVSLACFKMNMLPEEAINAATINAAFAMEVEGELGTIGIGKKASLILTKKISGYSFIPYSFGNNLIEKVFV
ncbi:MAG: imidazolonepropionase, partial [Sphingobacteriales bacterium]